MRRLLLGWFAIAHLAGSLLAGDGQPLLLAHGPFASKPQCLAFLREFVKTWNAPISGANLSRAYCLETTTGERAEVAVP